MFELWLLSTLFQIAASSKVVKKMQMSVTHTNTYKGAAFQNVVLNQLKATVPPVALSGSNLSSVDSRGWPHMLQEREKWTELNKICVAVYQTYSHAQDEFLFRMSVN